MRTAVKIFFTAACLYSLVTKAQVVPGYQGKKNFVNYQLSVSPAIRGVTYLNKALSASGYKSKADESLFIPFNCTHSLGYERVLGRKFSLALMYSFAASKTYINFSQHLVDPATGKQGTYYFTKIGMNCYGHYINTSFTFYRKNSLAPFGKYFKLSLGLCQMYTNFMEKEIKSDIDGYMSNGQQITVLTNNIWYGKNTMSLGMAFGSNRIYKGKFIVTRGVGFSFPIDFDLSQYSDFEPESELLARLRIRDIFTMFFGAGYLF